MNPLEQEAWHVVETLEEAGHEAYLVGGCVRDKLLRRDIYDYDITTSALPEEVQALFPHTIPTGIKHGTVSVLSGESRYEVTTFRTDGDYEDGRRPEAVVFVRSLTEDLARRDFTINAMALGRTGELHDPYKGREDLANRLIRAVGDPERRFAEDALRMLRGIRFAAQLRFQIEPETLRAISYEAGSLKQISRERIREEWQKMLLASPEIAIPLLQATDTLRHVISRPPTFDLAVNDPWGLSVDPWQLAGEWAARAPQDLALRYAVVFAAVKMDEARIAKNLAELKLSAQLKQEIKTALLFADADPAHWSEIEWRQRFFQYGAAAVRRGCGLFAALHAPERIAHWQQEGERRQTAQPLWSLQDLSVDGTELMAAGIPAGPLIGRVQKRLAHWVLQDPSRNRTDLLRSQALAWLEAGSL